MLSEQAKEKRREYMRQWRKKNKERHDQMLRDWKKNNPEKVKAAQIKYWEKKAKEKEMA